MSRKEFTVHDIILICSDIARKENMMVQIPQKNNRSIFQRFSKEFRKQTSRESRGSVDSETDPMQDWDEDRVVPEGKIEGKMGKDKEKSHEEHIPGLKGRDVIGISILVNEQGVPIKTYTEHEHIPDDEYNSAKHVITTHVPFLEEKTKKSPTSYDAQLNVKLLADVLTEDLDADKANKLKKRVSKVLIKLHTTDVSTARSFLKVDRFLTVRTTLKNEILNFVANDLKMISIPNTS